MTTAPAVRAAVTAIERSRDDLRLRNALSTVALASIGRLYGATELWASSAAPCHARPGPTDYPALDWPAANARRELLPPIPRKLPGQF
jgi:hypothetical protein